MGPFKCSAIGKLFLDSGLVHPPSHKEAEHKSPYCHQEVGGETVAEIEYRVAEYFEISENTKRQTAKTIVSIILTINGALLLYNLPINLKGAEIINQKILRGKTRRIKKVFW